MLDLDPFFAERELPDKSRYTPFTYRDETLGYVDKRHLDRIEPYREILAVSDDAVTMVDRGAGYAEQTAALDRAVRDIYDRDEAGFGKWCPETTPVVSRFASPPLFDLQRAAVGFFGVLTCGVHLNVFSRHNGIPILRIAERAAHLTSHPNLLDQAVAGFLPVGASPWEKLFEEAFDEAGLENEIVRRAKPVGSIEFAINREPGLQRGAVYVFDLEIAPDQYLVNRDGEVGRYLKMTPETVCSMVNTGRFKFDSALVAADFLLRHGCLDSERMSFLDIRCNLLGMGQFRD